MRLRACTWPSSASSVSASRGRAGHRDCLASRLRAAHDQRIKEIAWGLLAVYQEHHGSQPGAAENLHLVWDFPTTSIIIVKKIQRKSSGIRFASLYRVWSFKTFFWKDSPEKRSIRHENNSHYEHYPSHWSAILHGLCWRAFEYP